MVAEAGLVNLALLPEPWAPRLPPVGRRSPVNHPLPRAVGIVSPAGGTTGVGRRYRDGMSLADKLCPDRFSEMSGKMAAILGYILDEAWTEPAIVALSVTSDGFVTTDAEFLGEAADLDRNLLNLLVAAGLTNDERADFERRYRERVDDWRPVLAGPMPMTERLTRPDFGASPIRA